MRKGIGVMAIVVLGLPFAAGAAPLCNEQRTGAKSVELEVELKSSPPTFKPKDCSVGNDATIKWKAKGKKAFEVEFTGNTPDKGGRKKIGSVEKGWFPWTKQHEVEIESAPVGAKTTFPYLITSGGVSVDPSIIVDPAK